MDIPLIVIAVVVTALIFEYINGFHDTANAIATVVGTKVLTPRQAIVLAASTNMLGAFTGLAVAKTITSGLVDGGYINNGVLICALMGAIIWNLITWWFGMPSSSTHALVGGLVGAVIAVAVSINSDGGKTASGKDIHTFSGVKWEEIKEKESKKTAEAPPPIYEAVKAATVETKEGPKPMLEVDGTHFITLAAAEGVEAAADGAEPVKQQVVVFDGEVRIVNVKKKMDKGGLLHKVVIPMFSSPVVGFVVGLLFMSFLYVVLRWMKPQFVNRFFGKAQIASSAYMGFSHGMNDATKCMGIITLALVTASVAGQIPETSFFYTAAGTAADYVPIGERMLHYVPSWLRFGYFPEVVEPKDQHVPNWVIVTCALTMAAGTAAGGWRIIKTMGHKMVKLQPVHGFAAETTAATVLAVTGSLGMPVSTTHAITSSILGVGCAKRFSAMRLGVVERILWAWVLTIPAAGGVAFLLVWLTSKFGWLPLPIPK